MALGDPATGSQRRPKGCSRAGGMRTGFEIWAGWRRRAPGRCHSSRRARRLRPPPVPRIGMVEYPDHTTRHPCTISHATLADRYALSSRSTTHAAWRGATARDQTLNLIDLSSRTSAACPTSCRASEPTPQGNGLDRCVLLAGERRGTSQLPIRPRILSSSTTHRRRQHIHSVWRDYRTFSVTSCCSTLRDCANYGHLDTRLRSSVPDDE